MVKVICGTFGGPALTNVSVTGARAGKSARHLTHRQREPFGRKQGFEQLDGREQPGFARGMLCHVTGGFELGEGKHELPEAQGAIYPPVIAYSKSEFVVKREQEAKRDGSQAHILSLDIPILTFTQRA